MLILLAEEVQKRLPNLCGSPPTLVLTVGQAHIVCVECSFGVGVEISDERFLGQGVSRLFQIVKPVVVIEKIVSPLCRKFQTSPRAVTHKEIGEVPHHKPGSGTLVLEEFWVPPRNCNCRAF